MIIRKTHCHVCLQKMFICKKCQKMYLNCGNNIFIVKGLKLLLKNNTDNRIVVKIDRNDFEIEDNGSI